MKLILAVSTLTLASATAFAADLPSRRAPAVYAPAPVFTWTGFYVGAHVGGAFGKTDTVSSLAATGGVLDAVSASRSGFIGAATPATSSRRSRCPFSER